MLLIVGHVEAADGDVLPGRGRVHEEPVAEVDADVRELRLILEVHEIAGICVADGYLARGPEKLLIRPRYAIAGLPIGVVNESATVEALEGVGAAVAIARADHAH